ncbi:MAG: DUF6503 family protein [Aureispira sp.]
MTICRFFTAACLALVVACTPAENTDNSTSNTATTPQDPIQETVVKEVPVNANPYVAAVEEAHQRKAFLAKEAIKFDIVLEFGGAERLNGTVTTLTNSTKVRIDYKNGQSLLCDGDKVFAVDAENSASKRFAVYTWSYFFLFPYKLSDEGTKWAAYEQSNLKDKAYLTQKLTFEAGTGDDPDDWYITYANPENNLIEVAAYIVTAGGTAQEEAEKDPHAVSYGNYQDIDGIPIAHEWKFWGWKPDTGLTDQLGAATLSNIQFVTADPELFEMPEGYVQL